MQLMRAERALTAAPRSARLSAAEPHERSASATDAAAAGPARSADSEGTAASVARVAATVEWAPAAADVDSQDSVRVVEDVAAGFESFAAPGIDAAGAAALRSGAPAAAWTVEMELADRFR